MVNPFKEVKWNPDTAGRRAFATSLIIGFPCLALVLFLANRLATGGWHPAFPLQLAATGVGAGVLFWLVPAIARPFYVLWYAVACCIGFVVGNVVFAGVYVLVFAPIGIVRRALNPRVFRKGFDSATNSYWEEAEKDIPKKRYYHQY
ncbi:MAG TPA: hypothetical protein VFD27_17330 [Chthoniobacteraceae bacterium]|jgi:hypothetical protein|nr:hypothetical protein [Chthoniobacteraceae bacterium]